MTAAMTLSAAPRNGFDAVLAGLDAAGTPEVAISALYGHTKVYIQSRKGEPGYLPRPLGPWPDTEAGLQLRHEALEWAHHQGPKP